MACRKKGEEETAQLICRRSVVTVPPIFFFLRDPDDAQSKNRRKVPANLQAPGGNSQAEKILDYVLKKIRSF